MRKNLLSDGAKELSYEIREIVKKGHALKAMGLELTWENIGDPVHKNAVIPDWMKDVIKGLVNENVSYGYTDSKGDLNTRKYLAKLTNELNGASVSAEDILFFNGLGDAISTIYNLIRPTARIIGPSPAYSTHSSAEGAHASNTPITYNLDPNDHWYPDLDDLYNKVKYNPNVVGILIINPDNPTGMVYPFDTLKRIVEIAKEFDLFLISDEIYNRITYNGAKAYALAEVLEDVPGIALKGISKDLPWPGSRCGWMEVYNRDQDKEFSAFCRSLDDAKQIEVCSTTLPQLAIPKIYSHPEYPIYRKNLNEKIGKRSRFIRETLQDIPGVIINETFGAFYNSIIFKPEALNKNQFLKIENPEIQKQVESWVEGRPLDYRFVYYLLGATGICVVPISSFCSELFGFRVTLLEEDETIFQDTFLRLKKAMLEYLAS